MKWLRTLLPVVSLGVATACPALDAPNVVPIDDHLVTSGQPTRESLAALKSEGFEAVIYLAPGDVVDAIADEGEILRAQGIEFVHVPMVFKAPAQAEVEQVARALDRAAYRGVDPAKAYESVTRIWVPEGSWKQLVIDILAARGIAFDPF
jgi:protein tyrosine phosphatase (PTP) superfamily phosphohydrolase (DUF442 family)